MYEPKEPHTRRSASARALRSRGEYQSSLLNHPILEEEEPEERPPARSQPRPSSAPDYRSRSDYHRNPPAYEREDDNRMRYEDIPFEKRIEAQLHSLTDIHFTDIIRWLRKGFLRIIAAAILGAVLALLYAAIASPRYTVSTEIIIDPSNLNLVSDDVFSANPQRDSQLLEVESKLRVLTSRNVLTKVINDLNLTQDPEFNRPGRLDGLRSLISSPSAPEDRQLSVLRHSKNRSPRPATTARSSSSCPYGRETPTSRSSCRTRSFRPLKANCSNPRRIAPASLRLASTAGSTNCAAR